MRKAASFALLASLALPPALPAEERVDLDMVTQIRQEGFRNSKVMETASALMDRIGARLTGSPNMKKANDWTRQQLEDERKIHRATLRTAAAGMVVESLEGGRDVHRCLRRNCEETIVPIRAREVDGCGEEGRLVKREIKLKPGAAPQTSFSKDQVATARPATDRQIARTGAGLGQCVDDRVPRNQRLVCREPRLLSSCGINHVAAEKQHVAGRRTVLICRHRWNPGCARH